MAIIVRLHATLEAHIPTMHDLSIRLVHEPLTRVAPDYNTFLQTAADIPTKLHAIDTCLTLWLKAHLNTA